MPVMTTAKLSHLRAEVVARYNVLINALEARELKNKYDGCSRGSHWRTPENMRATVGTAMEIRLAAKDFRTILSELEKLKD